MLTRTRPIRAVANWVTIHSCRFGAQMPTRLPRRRPSASRPAAISSARCFRSYHDRRRFSASKIAASRGPWRDTVLSSCCDSVMKRSGSSVDPDTYESVPCGRSRSSRPPASQSELNGFAAMRCPRGRSRRARSCASRRAARRRARRGRSSTRRSARRPAACRPASPADRPHGTFIAGWPLTSNGAVLGSISKARWQ